MKTFLLFGFLISLSAYAANEGTRVVYDIDLGSSKGDMKMEGRYYIKKGSVRFESKNPSQPGGETVVIRTAGSKVSYIVMPALKMYMEIPVKDFMPANKSKDPDVQFKGSGQKKSVAGYSCEIYVRVVKGRKEEACVSTQLKDLFKELRDSMPADDSSSSTSRFPKGIDGFPLEYSVKAENPSKDQGQANMHMRVRELKNESLSASLFQVDKSYTKRDFPKMSPEMEQLQKQMKSE